MFSLFLISYITLKCKTIIVSVVCDIQYRNIITLFSISWRQTSRKTSFFTNEIESFSTFFLLYFLSFYRLQYTTKGTKALRLLGDRSVKTHCDKNSDQLFNAKDSALAKLAARGHSQRRLLLKNGEVNISRYLINFYSNTKAKKK